MNQLKDTFDSVVYSAGFAGLVAALRLKEKGENVLLINRYGFFGGTLTESLNLLQKNPSNFFQEGSISRKIFDELLKEKNSILFESAEHILFNPEVLKFVFQRTAVGDKLNLLFHVIPVNVDYSGAEFKLIVFGREGEIEIKTKKIYDFSSDFTLASLISPDSRKFIESRINFISLPIDKESLHDNYFIQLIKLNDNRYWISYKLDVSNLFKVENFAQEKLGYIDQILRNQKSRIQIVPPQAFYKFEFITQGNYENKIKFIYDYVDSFQTDEEFLIAQKIEGMI